MAVPWDDGTGFVPNYSAAGAKSQDRSEEIIGSKVLLEIYKQYKEDWSTNCVILCSQGHVLLPLRSKTPNEFSCGVLVQGCINASTLLMFVSAVVELLFDDCLDWLNWAHDHRRLPPLHLITQGSDNITGI
eukprot:COSAG02_NODE_7761_length_2859_cov_1.892391_2_plen_131_part_00